MFPPNTKVIVIDDMATMRKIIRKTLGDLGLKDVQEADDGATAWPMIQEAMTHGLPYQLIVSDWNMPKMKGLDLLKKVRQDEALKETPFLLVTAEAEMAQVVEAVKAGVDNYVVKPFTPKSFEEKLTAVFKKKGQKKAS